MCGPRDVSPTAVVFSRMHWECPFVRERSEGGSLDQGRGRPNPWLIRTFFQTHPLLGEGLSGDTNPPGQTGKLQEGALPHESGGQGKGDGAGRPGCPRETSRVGVIPDAVVLTPAVSGPPPAPGLDQAVQDARPQGRVTNCCRFFKDALGMSTCPGKARRREYGARTGKA